MKTISDEMNQMRLNEQHYFYNASHLYLLTKNMSGTVHDEYYALNSTSTILAPRFPTIFIKFMFIMYFKALLYLLFVNLLRRIRQLTAP